MRCGYLAGGLFFSDGSFAREVPNDPNIFFIGEEIAMAARAFTHGYDIYAHTKFCSGISIPARSTVRFGQITIMKPKKRVQ